MKEPTKEGMKFGKLRTWFCTKCGHRQMAAIPLPCKKCRGKVKEKL